MVTMLPKATTYLAVSSSLHQSHVICTPGESRTRRLVVRSHLFYPLYYGCLVGASHEGRVRLPSSPPPVEMPRVEPGC